MRVFIVVIAIVFGLLTLAHVARILFEDSALARDPAFMFFTLAAAVLCIWSCVMLRRLRR
jgi:membrane protein CcdC involved in cytochrome C biogenesis